MTALIKIKTDDVGCRKPSCSHRLSLTHRHHRRQETLFINAYRLKGPKKTKDERYARLWRKYHKFDPKDTIIICPWHHCEIHLLYDAEIRQDQEQRLKRLRDYTWPQSNSLMKKLEKLCLEWEVETTPGTDPVECEPDKRFPHRKKKRAKSKR